MGFSKQYETEFQGRIETPVKHLRWSFWSKQLKAKSRKLFLQKAPSYMFDYLMNTPLSLVVKEACFDKEPSSLLRTKNQENKALLNGTDVVNVEQWTKM